MVAKGAESRILRLGIRRRGSRRLSNGSPPPSIRRSLEQDNQYGCARFGGRGKLPQIEIGEGHRGNIGDIMPLTKSGKKVLSSMKKEYGGEKGKKVFYSSINKGKAGSKSWHRKGK